MRRVTVRYFSRERELMYFLANFHLVPQGGGPPGLSEGSLDLEGLAGRTHVKT